MTRRLAAGIAAVAAVAAAGPAAGPAAAAPVRSGAVAKVLDGDTIRLRAGRRTATVDLVGVRAPRRGTCFGTKAVALLRARLPVGTRVRLADEPRVAGRGRYVTRAGRLVNAAVLRAGAARVAGTRRFARGAALRAAARAAVAARRGLHGRCGPRSPASPAPSPGAGQAPTPVPPPDPTPTPAGGGAVPVADRMRAALDALQMTTFRTDSNSSDRADTLFCAGGRLERTEEFTPRDPSAGPIVTRFAGTWAIADTLGNPDGSLTAQVLLRADDQSIELRRLTLVLGPDGKVRQTGQGATDSARSDAACRAQPAGSGFENDTAEARRRLAEAVLGRRFDVPGIGISDFCPGPRLRRTEDGRVVADGPLGVEWAVSDGGDHAGIVRVEDRGRGSSRRVQVVLPSGGRAPELQELGGGDASARAVTPTAAAC